MAIETKNIIAEKRRISWQAVFAGVVIALVLQLALTLLGVGIGASTISPTEQANPMEGIGTGAAIWVAVTALLGLFAGGWVAARLAGEPRETDGLLHGLLTWGVATLVAFYLVTTTVGSLIGGAVGMAGRLASAAGSGIKEAAPSMLDTARAQLNLPNIDTSNIRQEAENMLRQTGKPELQPENLRNEAQNAVQGGKDTAAGAAQNPQAADEQFNNAFNRLFSGVSQTANAATDKDALVNVLVARTNMPRDEARRTVDRWQQTYQQAVAKYEQVKSQAIQQTKEAADTAATGVSRGALWTFLILLLSAISAAAGGYVGTPERREFA